MNNTGAKDEPIDLTLQFDALQELSNIGVGHSATALSHLINRKVEMSTPRISWLKSGEILKQLNIPDGEKMVAVYTKAEEKDAHLNLLLLMDTASVGWLIQKLRTGFDPQNMKNLDGLSRSILDEAGNILLIHALSAINNFTDSLWFPINQELCFDTIEHIIENYISSIITKPSNNLFLIECDVFTGTDEKIKGNILLLPNQEGLSILMDKLYGEGWKEVA